MLAACLYADKEYIPSPMKQQSHLGLFYGIQSYKQRTIVAKL